MVSRCIVPPSTPVPVRLSGFVRRSFTSFPAAAEEATLSRIFAGVHFRFDLTTGQRLGDDVADFVVDNFLTARDRDD